MLPNSTLLLPKLFEQHVKGNTEAASPSLEMKDVILCFFLGNLMASLSKHNESIVDIASLRRALIS